jgi:hypothetical protein
MAHEFLRAQKVSAKRPLVLDQIAAEVDARIATLAGPDQAAVAKMKQGYLERKTIEAELHRDVENATNAARLAAQPKPHLFTLRRTQ